MFFAVSCGSSGNNENKDNTDTGETVTDEDTADSGHGDTTPEEPDNEDPGRKQGELYGECYPNATCNKGLVCDEENNICIKDPDSGSNDSDNDAAETDDDGDSTPEQPDEADSADDSDTSEPTDDADTSDSQSDDDTDADSGEPEEHCKTVDGKLWWSSKKPEKPYDPEKPDENKMDWESAIEHCKKLKESNACGYSDWHLPTIDELKTLIKWRRDSQCMVSDTNNCLSLNDCWTCSSCSDSCTEGANGECNCGDSYFEDGRYSKLGDVGWLWSSSVMPGDHSYLAWGVNFYYAKLYYEGKSTYKNVYVRCVSQ